MTAAVLRGRHTSGRQTSGRLTRLAAVGSATLTFAVVVAPAAVVVMTGGRSGVADPVQADLVSVSAVVGGLAALLAWRRVPRLPLRGGDEATSRWIAALWALVTTAVTSSVLPPLALHALAGALDPDAGWAVPALWAGCLIAAVGAGAAVHQGVRRWLTRTPLA